jgi:hypothetical protein
MGSGVGPHFMSPLQGSVFLRSYPGGKRMSPKATIASPLGYRIPARWASPELFEHLGPPTRAAMGFDPGVGPHFMAPLQGSVFLRSYPGGKRLSPKATIASPLGYRMPARWASGRPRRSRSEVEGPEKQLEVGPPDVLRRSRSGVEGPEKQLEVGPPDVRSDLATHVATHLGR